MGRLAFALVLVLTVASTAPRAQDRAAVLNQADELMEKRQFREAVELLEKAASAAGPAERMGFHAALSVVTRFWASSLLESDDAGQAAEVIKRSIAFATPPFDLALPDGPQKHLAEFKTEAMVIQARVFEKLGRPDLAKGALVLVYFRDKTRGLDPSAVCGDAYEQLRVAAAQGTGPETWQRWNSLKECAQPLLKGVKAFQQVSGDPEVFLTGMFTAFLEEEVIPLVDQSLTRSHTAVAGALAGAMAAKMFEMDTKFTVPLEMLKAARELLLESAQQHWHHVTAALPSMSAAEQREFMNLASAEDAERLIGIAFQFPDVDAADALQAALLRKQVLVEAGRQESVSVRAALAGAPEPWRAAWNERQRYRRQYATLALDAVRELDAKGGPEAEAGRRAQLFKLAADIDRIDKELRLSNGAYAEQARLQEITLEQVKNAVGASDALVEYVHYRAFDFGAKSWGNAKFGAFVLMPGRGGVAAVPLGDAAAIDADVARLRAQIQAFVDRPRREEPTPAELSESEAAIGQISAALRSKVWDPVEKALGTVRRVYLAPDGDLNLVPFEALAQRRSNRWDYLVEQRELVYVGSGRDLARLRLTPAPRSGRKTAVLIGDPNFDAEVASPGDVSAAAAAGHDTANALPTLGSAAGGGAPRLRLPSKWRPLGLAASLRGMNNQLTTFGWSVTSYTGERATEGAALSLQSPRLLQFLTHGYVLDRAEPGAVGWENPLLRSMLILAGVATDRARSTSSELGDGVLTAYEVTGIDLRGTELVNLTACETGLGEVTPEGVAGLRQAFLMSGARSVTASLWSVPAAESVEQIQDFYRRWQGGGAAARSRYVAFRGAQLAALKTARDRFASGHPVYWAGMVYVGDPGDAAPAAASPRP